MGLGFRAQRFRAQRFRVEDLGKENFSDGDDVTQEWAGADASSRLDSELFVKEANGVILLIQEPTETRSIIAAAIS